MNGSEQRDKKWSNPRRRFKLRYLYEDVTDGLWWFAIGHNGIADSFIFDPHDFLPTLYESEEITMRFASDEIGRSIVIDGIYNLDIELVEVK